MLLKKLLIICVAIGLASCTKYRNLNDYNSFDNVIPSNGEIGFGSLRINEFICKGVNDKALQHFSGSDAKWFELYNPTDKEITLTAGKWFVTDSIGEPTKYEIPENTNGVQWSIPSKGFLAILCLKSTSIPCASKINATFSLSSTVGAIGIFYQADSNSAIIPVDTLHYDFGSGALSGISYGRTPNGSGPIVQLQDVTPETSN